MFRSVNSFLYSDSGDIWAPKVLQASLRVRIPLLHAQTAPDHNGDFLTLNRLSLLFKCNNVFTLFFKSSFIPPAWDTSMTYMKAKAFGR